jgi:hypothetical protein
VLTVFDFTTLSMRSTRSFTGNFNSSLAEISGLPQPTHMILIQVFNAVEVVGFIGGVGGSIIAGCPRQFFLLLKQVSQLYSFAVVPCLAL